MILLYENCFGRVCTMLRLCRHGEYSPFLSYSFKRGLILDKIDKGICSMDLFEYNTLKRTETGSEVWWWYGAEDKAGWSIYRAECQAYQKRKRDMTDWNGNIELVEFCNLFD